MSTPASHDPELDALLGAYALDALEADERELVEAYIADNPVARDEVDELRESAASLALAPVDDTVAPPELWERISSAIESESTPAPAASASAAMGHDRDELAARRMSRRARWTTALAAVAAVAAIVLAAQVISLNGRLDKSHGFGETAAAAAFDRASRAQGARQASLIPSKGAEVARVVILPDGNGYLKSDGLAQLDADKTYQLWAITGSAAHPVAISAGVLGPNPSAAAFRATTDVRGFAITIEHAGGVAQSSQIPYAEASLA
jgi:anti-sigma-K factor RskA